MLSCHSVETGVGGRHVPPQNTNTNLGRSALNDQGSTYSRYIAV